MLDFIGEHSIWREEPTEIMNMQENNNIPVKESLYNIMAQHTSYSHPTCHHMFMFISSTPFCLLLMNTVTMACGHLAVPPPILFCDNMLQYIHSCGHWI